MTMDLFNTLEVRISRILEQHTALKQENLKFKAEIRRLHEERDELKARIDGIIRKLEGI